MALLTEADIYEVFGLRGHAAAVRMRAGLDTHDTLVMQDRNPRNGKGRMNRYEALSHAISAHGADTDWCGNLYIFHPMEVAWRLDSPFHTEASTEDFVVVALLHDVLEDTVYPLEPADFSAEQWEALQLVTHTPELTYREYIERIATSGSRIAIMVKLADLSHNMSDERKENLTPEKLEVAQSLERKRYIPARQRLWDALGGEWWPA